MRALAKILTGVAGTALVAGAASPAAAQYYPGTGYGYGYGQDYGRSIGAIIDSVIGAAQYGYRSGVDRYAIEQCARAAEYRANRNYGHANYGYGYGGYGYDRRYQGGARVVQITRVERRGDGFKVWGLIDSGRGGYGNYGGYGGYGNYGYPRGGYADLSFDCRVDHRGRVRDVDLRRSRYGY